MIGKTSSVQDRAFYGRFFLGISVDLMRCMQNGLHVVRHINEIRSILG